MGGITQVSQEVLITLADNEAATVALGAKLAERLPMGAVVFLHGQLGAGKTTLVRGCLRAFGFEGAVKSPTYTLVEPYKLGHKEIYHFDLYRLSEPEELEFMGVRDYFHANALCFIEWPERGEGILPTADVEITIEVRPEGRVARISGPATHNWECMSD